MTTALGVSFFGDVLTPKLVLGAVATLGGVALVAVAERWRLAQPQVETGAP